MLVAALAWARPAAADCLAPPLELLWTYPADGQQDVPLDAAIWLLTSLAGQTPSASVELNGENVAPLRTRSDLQLGQAAFKPTTLRPETTYQMRVVYGAPDGTSKTYGASFRTGVKHAGTPKSAILSLQTRSIAFEPDHPCRALFGLGMCFDNPDQRLELYTFEQRSENIIGWYVKPAGMEPGTFWPAACGHPTLKTDALPEGNCFYLHGVDTRGELATLNRHCKAGSRSREPFGKQSAPAFAGALKSVAVKPAVSAAAAPESAARAAPAPTPAASKPPAEPTGGSCSVHGRGVPAGPCVGVLMLAAAWCWRCRASAA